MSALPAELDINKVNRIEQHLRVDDARLYKFLFFKTQCAHLALLIATTRAALSSMVTKDAKQAIAQQEIFEKELLRLEPLRDVAMHDIFVAYNIRADEGDVFTDTGEIRRAAKA